MTIRDVDKGAKKLLRQVRHPGSVKVGIMGSEAAEKHSLSGDTVAEIGTFHEFGLGVPKRSFIRAYVDENASEIEDRIRSAARRIINQKSTVDQELEILGLWIQGQIQKRISAGIPPELAESTKRRKGSSIPLIDTGQLRSSITYEVEQMRSGNG